MRDFFLNLNCRFTDIDKEKCKPVIHRLVDLANLARAKGILALELEMEQEQSFFLKTGISLVVDGTDPVLVKQILQNIILADEYSGSPLLERLIMAEGVLALQQGENPRIIALKLSSMLGERYIVPLCEELSAERNRLLQMHRFLDTLNDKAQLPESAQFETKLLQMDNRSIQLVLSTVDSLCALTALYGCGRAVIYKIFDNVSMNICSEIIENWEFTKPLRKELILDRQEQILKRIRELENRGEIINISESFLGPKV